MTPENEAPETQGLPEPSLTILIQTLFAQAMVAAGRLPNPATGETTTEPDLAQFQVKLMEMLQEKTEGNRTEEENHVMEEMLHAARLAYVDLQKGGA